VNGDGALRCVAYAACVNLDSSALKDAGVDCSTTWDRSEFQSPRFEPQKSGDACVEEPTASGVARNLIWGGGGVTF